VDVAINSNFARSSALFCHKASGDGMKLTLPLHAWQAPCLVKKVAASRAALVTLICCLEWARAIFLACFWALERGFFLLCAERRWCEAHF